MQDTMPTGRVPYSKFYLYVTFGRTSKSDITSYEVNPSNNVQNKTLSVLRNAWNY
jgi:hypothetical protein